MINPRERRDHYRIQGFDYEDGYDEAGTEYERHAHERTILYTVSGSLALTLYDQEPPRVVELTPGQEFVIEDGVEHSAVVGPRGWKYIAASNPAVVSNDVE